MLPPFQILGRVITGYGIAVTIGLLVCFFFLTRQANRRLDGDGDALLVLLFAGGGAFLGGHLLFGIVSLANYGFQTITSFDGFFRFMNDFFGGSVFYGGLIGGIIAALITVRVMKLPWYPMVDLLTTIIPLFHCFGRIGCFLGGCCYGIPSEIGFTFRHSIVHAANGVNRFPVQLLEAGFNLALFFVLFSLFKNEKLRGKLLFLYLSCYSFARFFLEYLRGDSVRGEWAIGLSTSQIISIALFIIGGLGLIIKINNINSTREAKS
ncbi:MAG: prolipoprotein diacylglyceryl transferase [Ruminococcus sp.]|jgi:phosphatidylglycerol:prolipoprotein diacylglycerol transferase|nr:prolipoprotein diacylglyceryl transferase [Ruminococcus sp.]